MPDGGVKFTRAGAPLLPPTLDRVFAEERAARSRADIERQRSDGDRAYVAFQRRTFVPRYRDSAPEREPRVCLFSSEIRHVESVQVPPGVEITACPDFRPSAEMGGDLGAALERDPALNRRKRTPEMEALREQILGIFAGPGAGLELFEGEIADRLGIGREGAAAALLAHELEALTRSGGGQGQRIKPMHRRELTAHAQMPGGQRMRVQYRLASTEPWKAPPSGWRSTSINPRINGGDSGRGLSSRDKARARQ